MSKTIYTPDRQTQSAKLVQAREAAALTQKQVEEATGISQSELSKIEKGQRKVESLTLKRLADLYSKPLSFFLSPAFLASEEAVDYITSNENALIASQIKARKGPDKFREALLKTYNSTCVITGCQIPALLEAARIKASTSSTNDDPSNGLLLRADIHTLFDLNLIGINPEMLTVGVHPDVMKDGYENLNGKKLTGNPIANLNKEALRSRWVLFLGKE